MIHRNIRSLLIVVAGLIVMFASVDAHALTSTNALSSSATVSGSCTISSVASLDFGSYDTTASTDDDDGVGNVQFTCTKGTAYDVYVTGTRSMTDGTDTLNFEMYQELARTTAWPSTSPGVTGTAADNTTITKDIYGRIAQAQNVEAGTYAGSVTVTVSY